MGSQKAASANVETVFSGVGGMLEKATTLGADLVADYTICHHNWQYDFLEPSDEEVVAAWTVLYGPEPRDSDAESDGSAGSDNESDDDAEGDGESSAAAATSGGAGGAGGADPSCVAK